MLSDDDNIQAIIAALKEQHPILMVGAGSSVPVGYPDWPKLVEELRREFAPDITNDGRRSEAELADDIKRQIERSGRLSEYHKFLSRRFGCPPTGIQHHDFHTRLVQLGFRGVVTANYDLVLESAIADLSQGGGYWACRPIDLCDEGQPYRVFEFLRTLSPGRAQRCVLHLHGHCERPERIILTRQDYLRSYGDMAAGPEVPDPQREELKVSAGHLRDSPGTALRTMHHKVIWTLLTAHPLVFVGFSMRDEYFTRMLEIVQHDFALGKDAVHFAFAGYRTEAEKNTIEEDMRRYGVAPVFYPIPPLLPGEAREDHSGLGDLIHDVADMMGVPRTVPDIDERNRAMWGLSR